MTAQPGETDQILRVKLESRLLAARWLEPCVAANGAVGVEVAAQNVGHGAPIRISFKDSEGNAAGCLEGRVLQNRFRAHFRPDSKAAGKTLVFEAELPLHGIRLTGGPLAVLSRADSAGQRWTRVEPLSHGS